MGALGLCLFRVYVVCLAVWLGSGVFDSVSTHFGLYLDPLAWAAHPPAPGAVNPWPFTTILLLLATVAALVVCFLYRGPGKREALISLLGLAIILIATFAYFVPELGRMFGSDASLAEADLIERSRLWVVLNVARQFVLLVLFWFALLALGQVSSRKITASP